MLPWEGVPVFMDGNTVVAEQHMVDTCVAGERSGEKGNGGEARAAYAIYSMLLGSPLDGGAARSAP